MSDESSPRLPKASLAASETSAKETAAPTIKKSSTSHQGRKKKFQPPASRSTPSSPSSPSSTSLDPSFLTPPSSSAFEARFSRQTLFLSPPRIIDFNSVGAERIEGHPGLLGLEERFRKSFTESAKTIESSRNKIHQHIQSESEEGISLKAFSSTTAKSKNRKEKKKDISPLSPINQNIVQPPIRFPNCL